MEDDEFLSKKRDDFPFILKAPNLKFHDRFQGRLLGGVDPNYKSDFWRWVSGILNHIDTQEEIFDRQKFNELVFEIPVLIAATEKIFPSSVPSNLQTGPTEHTPKPEYLIAKSRNLLKGIRWDKVPFNS